MPFETATPLGARVHPRSRPVEPAGCLEQRRTYELAKRGFDICFSVVILIATLPLFVIIACAIKLSSRGPVIFKQVRIGQNRRREAARKSCPGRSSTERRGRQELKGQPITIYKFRTMRAAADPYRSKLDGAYGERLTPVGRFLRAASMDELPQFVNVLLGDLSIVGPRPEMPFIVERYGPIEAQRLSVKPGITGLWQIYGRRDQLIHENIHYDLEYLARRSLWLDLLIVVKTALFVLRIKNI